MCYWMQQPWSPRDAHENSLSRHPEREAVVRHTWMDMDRRGWSVDAEASKGPVYSGPLSRTNKIDVGYVGSLLLIDI